MEERVFKLSLKEAKEWYKSNDNTKKDIALKLFTKEELTKVNLPNNLEEYYESLNYDDKKDFKEDLDRLETYPNLKTMYILRILRDCYRQGWLPNWSDGIQNKYTIVTDGGVLDSSCFSYINRFLSFQSEAICDMFLKNFRDLIIQAGDLI